MFSIIIPTYNRQNEIIRCLNSIKKQSFKKFEILIVDNGSTDNTRQVVHDYFKDYKCDFKYIFQKNSGSPAGSRNTGIKNSKYDWIAFLDSDDTWIKSKLYDVHEFIKVEKSSAAIAHWEYQKYGKKIRVAKLGQKKILNQYKDLLLNGNRYSTSTMVVNREIFNKIGLFNVSKKYYSVEDYKMWLEISKVTNIKCINKPLSTYFHNDNSYSNNLEFHYSNLKNLINDELKNYPIFSFLKRKLLSRVDYYYGRSLQKLGDQKALKILLKSFIHYPFSLKKIISIIFSLIGLRI